MKVGRRGAKVQQLDGPLAATRNRKFNDYNLSHLKFHYAHSAELWSGQLVCRRTDGGYGELGPQSAAVRTRQSAGQSASPSTVPGVFVVAPIEDSNNRSVNPHTP